jgi:hypothetical protein
VERITLTRGDAPPLHALVPVTHRERACGLLGRDPAPILFERARSIHTFGMRMPIRVAFLDRGYGVLRVITVPPRRLAWSLRARHVLEAPIGTDLRAGERLARTPSRGGEGSGEEGVQQRQRGEGDQPCERRSGEGDGVRGPGRDGGRLPPGSVGFHDPQPFQHETHTHPSAAVHLA